jgi:hypothetical protein
VEEEVGAETVVEDTLVLPSADPDCLPPLFCMRGAERREVGISAHDSTTASPTRRTARRNENDASPARAFKRRRLGDGSHSGSPVSSPEVARRRATPKSFRGSSPAGVRTAHPAMERPGAGHDEDEDYDSWERGLEVAELVLPEPSPTRSPREPPPRRRPHCLRLSRTEPLSAEHERGDRVSHTPTPRCLSSSTCSGSWPTYICCEGQVLQRAHEERGSHPFGRRHLSRQSFRPRLRRRTRTSSGRKPGSAELPSSALLTADRIHDPLAAGTAPRSRSAGCRRCARRIGSYARAAERVGRVDRAGRVAGAAAGAPARGEPARAARGRAAGAGAASAGCRAPGRVKLR